MERAIAHMDLDNFYVSCERLRNSVSENQPVIIGGGDRGVVASCSYEARKFGVRPTLTITKMAKMHLIADPRYSMDEEKI